MGSVSARLDGVRRQIVTDASGDAAGQRRIALVVYLALAPLGLAGSILVGHGRNPSFVLVKAVLLGAGIAWIWRRRTLSKLERILLFAVIPAVSTSSSA